MVQRFVVALDSASQEEQDKITNYLKSKSFGYWHWFRDLWLVTDPTYSWSVAMLRDKLQEQVPGTTMLIVPVENGTQWAGYGSKQSFEWLHDEWKK